MKKTKEIVIVLILIMSILITLFPSVVNADDERKTTVTTIGTNEYTWSYIEKDGKVTDLKCDKVSNYYADKNLILPKQLDGKDVIDIAPGAIANLSSVTSLQIPNTVTKIQDNTFASTNFTGTNAYVSIPSSVTEIGEYAFANCTYLDNVSISGNITEIKEGTFQACSQLKSITIPASVTKIADSAFQMCTSLKTVCGTAGSYAETWAKQNGYTFQNLNNTSSAVAPKVDKVMVTSPTSGTYKAPQTVKIRVYFTEEITGTSTPTLKIRFGTSPERTVTNGVIRGEYQYIESKQNIIEYSYNIQADDEGQLQAVSLTGGTIKDANGVDAVLSCPIISGQTIVANKTGTVTNNTENQDKVNDETKKDDGNTTPTTPTTTTEKTKNLDPDNLITWPLLITNGTGNLGVKSTETGYKLYYQCTELSDTNYDKIKKLSESGSNKYAESVVNLITKYDDSKWTQTTDKKMTITDLTKFSGSKKFVIWAKLVRSNGETVYDWEIYTVNGTKSTATTTNQNTTVTKTNTAKVDSTTANTILPKTGKDVIIYIAIGVAIVIGIVRYKKCKEYSDIK